VRAAIAERYGPPEVVVIREVPTPEPGPGQVRVRVRATTVASGDARVRGFELPRAIFVLPARAMLGLTRPRRAILGTEYAGTVDALGEGVTRFAVGDAVFGMQSFDAPAGTHAEYLVTAADGLIEPKPASLPFEEAGCLCFGLLTARHFLEKEGGLAAGDRLAVVGAAGAVGCAAVQLARHVGARVTAVASARNAELLRSLGADRVVDRHAEDFTRLGPGEAPYTHVFDTVGATSFGACRRALTADGLFLTTVMGAREIGRALLDGLTRRRRIVIGVASEVPDDLTRFRRMVEEGAYRSVIDSTFPFERIVEAHRRVGQWSKRGNVVVTFDGATVTDAAPGSRG
jgi:NADPH:quinone reductase-like Zn-dependent oxidoreductase